MRKQIVTIIMALAGILPANAQYTFTLNVSWSGNCSGYTSQMNQAIRGFQAQTINGFPTRELCEQSRAICHQELGHIELVYYDVKTGKVIKREATNCKLNVTTSPCTGRPMAGSVGMLNALGVSQGTSFYSANTASEIQDWANDDMERMLALDKDFQSFEPSNVATGDQIFDNAKNGIDSNMTFIPINIREGGSSIVQQNDSFFGEVLDPNDERWKYFIEKDFADELHSEYYKEKQINIEAALYKSNKSDYDLDLLHDYQAWKEQKLNEAGILKDMAVCSALSYADDNSAIDSYTKYKLVTRPVDESMDKLMQIVEMCNGAGYNQGFHAEVFYNTTTKEYAISFRGTEATLEDIITDIKQGAGKVPTQYRMAIEIGEVIRQIKETNPNININITGHSLGGGLATIAGVVSGQPTYVFNPAGVHRNTFEYAGVSQKVHEGNFNITRISENKDILTNVQENPSLSILRDGAKALFFSVAKYKTKNEIASANYAESLLPSATGNLKLVDTGVKGVMAPLNAHRIVPMAQNLNERYNTIQSTMNESVERQVSRIYYRE